MKPETLFSAFIEDMTFGSLPKDVQTEVLRFVDAKKGTPVVHYGMTVTELVMKADAENLKSARAALGTLRASRARDDVMGKVKSGGKYVLLMNDRIVDGHHFLAKAERGAVTSSLNVLDLTPARLSTGKVTEFAGKPFAGYNAKRHARTGGLNDSFRKSYNREHGSNLKRPVTTAPGKLKPGSKAANRRASFCARMGGMKGATSKGGQLTPKGAALKRWNCETQQRLTEFAEEPRRNRTRELRDRIGIAKDVAGLGVTVGAGVGAHKLYKGGREVLRKVGPQIGSAAKAWHKAALKTGKTLDTVKDAVAPAAAVNRGVGGMGRKIVQGARKVAAFLHSDPRPVQNFTGGNKGNGVQTLKPLFSPLSPVPTLGFSEERKAQWNAALIGGAVPLVAGGAVLGTRGGRNALRGLLKRVDKNDPRRVRMAGLVQKRKDASLKRAGDKAVAGARAKFRAEALPKPAKEPGLKDAVKTVAKRAKRKVIAKVAGIGAEQSFTVVDGCLRSFEKPKRDALSKARDAALIGAGVAGTGAVVYGASKMKEAGKVADNIRNTTAIGSDMGRVYRKARKVVGESVDAFKGGVKEGMSQPAPKWKKGVIKIGKKLRLLEAGSKLKVSSFKLNQFAIGGLVGGGIGTLIGSQVGERFKYKTRNALKKKLIPKLGQKWGRRVARAGQFVPENAGAVVGGVAGSIVGGGIRRKAAGSEFQVPGFKFPQRETLNQFGGKEQLKEIDSGAFPDPLDVFVGRKKGYLADTVKSYHREKNYVKDVRSGKKKGSPQAVAAAEAEMKRLRGSSVEASHGQVYRSLLKKGDTVRRVSERGGGLIRDAVKHVKGEAREKDPWGRQKKREWEKPWFQRTKNQVAAAAALGGGALLLKKNPRLRAKVDRGVRMVQRKVNSVVPDTFTGVKPLRVKGQKTAASVQAKRQSVAQAKFTKTKAATAAQAQKIATAAQAARAAKPKRGTGTPKLKGFAVLNGRLVQFDDPLDAGWDLRDARGRSARVFAPGAGSRDRRPKKWHEKVENERKLWGAAALAGTASGAAAVRKIVKRGADKEIKRRVAQIGAAVRKNYVPKSKPSAPTNIHAFKPMKPGTAA